MHAYIIYHIVITAEALNQSQSQSLGLRVKFTFTAWRTLADDEPRAASRALNCFPLAFGQFWPVAHWRSDTTPAHRIQMARIGTGFFRIFVFFVVFVFVSIFGFLEEAWWMAWHRFWRPIWIRFGFVFFGVDLLLAAIASLDHFYFFRPRFRVHANGGWKQSVAINDDINLSGDRTAPAGLTSWRSRAVSSEQLMVFITKPIDKVSMGALGKNMWECGGKLVNKKINQVYQSISIWATKFGDYFLIVLSLLIKYNWKYTDLINLFKMLYIFPR